jgi:predicted ATPase
VFVGGCTLEAAEAVCGTPGDTASSLLDGVASLLDKSLLLQIEHRSDEPRLMLLETIREFGLECLVASGELEAAQQAHAAYYVALAKKDEPEPWRNPQTAWVQQVEQEYDNVRATFRWLVKQGEESLGVQHRELALQLGGVLMWF